MKLSEDFGTGPYQPSNYLLHVCSILEGFYPLRLLLLLGREVLFKINEFLFLKL